VAALLGGFEDVPAALSQPPYGAGLKEVLAERMRVLMGDPEIDANRNPGVPCPWMSILVGTSKTAE
jgi:hypothetical protein